MPRVGLNSQLVIEEAGRLADEVGLENLTLAALATRLGVRQPSLYKHVASIAALRQAIGVRTVVEMTDVMARAAVGRSGSDAIQAMARTYRDWAKAHPSRYQAAQRAPEPGDTAHEEAAAAAIQLYSDVFAGFGLGDSDTIDAIRGLRASMHGFVSIELAGGFAIPLDIDHSYHRLIERFC